MAGHRQTTWLVQPDWLTIADVLPWPQLTFTGMQFVSTPEQLHNSVSWCNSDEVSSTQNLSLFGSGFGTDPGHGASLALSIWDLMLWSICLHQCAMHQGRQSFLLSTHSSDPTGVSCLPFLLRHQLGWAAISVNIFSVKLATICPPCLPRLLPWTVCSTWNAGRLWRPQCLIESPRSMDGQPGPQRSSEKCL